MIDLDAIQSRADQCYCDNRKCVACDDVLALVVELRAARAIQENLAEIVCWAAMNGRESASPEEGWRHALLHRLDAVLAADAAVADAPKEPT